MNKCPYCDCDNKNHNNGMNTKIWGPPTWIFLHFIALGYPCKLDTKNKTQLKQKK